MELPARVRHAADLDDAILEERLVARVVVTDELAGPGTQELTGMQATAAVVKVVDHSSQFIVFAAAVAPQIRAVRSPKTWLEHRHRRLIGMEHRTLQQDRL